MKALPLLLLLSTATAHAAPAWCGKTKPRANQGVSDALGKEAGDALVGIYMTLCFPSGDDAQHAGDVEAARRTWSQRLAMTDADWSDVADFAESDLGARRGLRIPIPTGGVPVKAWSAMSPIDQFVAIDEHRVDGAFVDPAYIADALGPQLSEAGRVAYVQQCLRAEQPIEWAMCAPDIAALDATKLGTELRGDREREGFDRVMVRLVADSVRGKLAARRAAVKQLVAKDAAYEKLFAIGNAQRDAWAGRWRDRGELVALVAAMDDANVTHSRKASAGCAAKTEAALADAIGKLPARTFALPHASDQDIDDELASRIAGEIVAAPEGYLASLALVMCADRKGDAASSTLASALGRWPGHRGPRTSTATAILTAGIELDDRNARLEPPDVMRPWLGGTPDRVGEAVVESLKAGTITYTAKPVTIVVATGCAPTNRVSQITLDGRLVYEQQCTGTATRVVDRRFPPAKIDERYATAVKHGAFAAVGTGVVWAVWPSAKAKAPSAVLGVAVK